MAAHLLVHGLAVAHGAGGAVAVAPFGAALQPRYQTLKCASHPSLHIEAP